MNSDEPLPTIQIVMATEPGVVDAYGEFSMTRFGTLPAVGDVLSGLNDFGVYGAVRVISRHFFRHEDRLLSWWMLLVEEVREQHGIIDIDRDVRQAYVEIRAEEQAQKSASMIAKTKIFARRR